jgi:iron complex transport system substrate-binding protein
VAAGEVVVTRHRRDLLWPLCGALAIAAACLASDPAAAGPQRVVSLIPAVTEMIFAMGDGGRLVGVSSFDRYPPEVSRIARVGALLDPDTERILGLRPDLVVVYNTQTELKERLDRAGIPYFSYQHRTLADVPATIRALGTRLSAAAAADALAARMDGEIAAVRRSVAGLKRPRTLLVFERDSSSLRNILASGGFGFMHDMLDAAGGDDVFADIRKESVQATSEMILARRPEAIVELRYGDSVRAADLPREMNAWNALAALPAVRDRRVHVLVGDEFVTPGPRITGAIRILARTLHPGLK